MIGSKYLLCIFICVTAEFQILVISAKQFKTGNSLPKKTATASVLETEGNNFQNVPRKNSFIAIPDPSDSLIEEFKDVETDQPYVLFAQSLTGSQVVSDLPDQPYFVEPRIRHVVTRTGQTASLACNVKNIGDKQLSWIRGNDLHVLSSGLTVFATDSRIKLSSAGENWTLTISFSQKSDGGSYACQLNTQPPIASWFNLSVIEARAVIEGPSTLYVQADSNFSLNCIVKEELVIPGLILWYHGEVLVPRESKRIKIVTEVTNVTISQLNISKASLADSGNYSCWPSSGKQDTVLVHVIQGCQAC